MPRCAVCGQDNPGGFRFCGACGASLTAPARAHAEERRLVTVLFCDLVGFTARSDQADPEDVGALLRPYHARFRAEIERLGGTLDKFIGDGVMAVFGAPVAHEDDPERAVRCALGMLAAIDELNQAHPTLDLAVRIGITTGEALVRLGPGQQTEGVVGDVVNTASRLEGVAPVGGVVVGEATFRATSRLFDYEELAPVKVKGKADPVPVWRLEGARSRTGIEAVRRSGTPFVGRQGELELLKGLFEQTLADRTVRLVTVVGEPGVGKSRFVGELAAILDARPELVTWRQGRCLPYGDGITFWALGEIVKAEAGILESDPPAEVSDKLQGAVAALLPDPSEREWLRARLAPLVGVAGPDAVKAERTELFAAWRRLIEAMAASHPLVLVVEDLHWADQAMLEFLGHLVEHAAGLPLLILATARPELLERHPTWGDANPAATMLRLGALTDLEVARLVAALVGRSMLPVGVQALLLERAGGNPLYAEEFARLLADRGLAAENQVTDEVAAVPDIPVPETVHGLIAARLDALDPEVRALVQDAAVVGRVFWPGAVAAMDGAGSAIQAGLAELERKQLVQRVRASSVQHQDEYVFWHALVRDVAYAQIPRAGRARRHQAVAEWVEMVAGERVGDLAEVVAHHYGQALAYARAAREPQARIDKLIEPTRRFLVLAGDRTINLDLDRARAYYRQAVELGQPQDPERPHLLVRTGRVAFQSGDYPEAVAVYEEAIADLRERGDLQGLGATLGRLAVVLWNQGETRRANAVLTEAIELLEREPPGPELASAYVRMAGDRVVSGHAREALDWADRALAIADDRGGLPRIRPRALDTRGMARCDLGDFGGMDDLRAGLVLGLELGSSYDTAVLYSNLAEPVWLVEGPEAALEVCGDGVDFAVRRGLSEPAMWLRASTLGPLLDLGRWEEAVALADEAIAWDLAHGGDYLAIGCRRHVTLVLTWQGDLIAAGDLAMRILPRARQIDDLQQLVPALVVAALVEQATGDNAAALALVEEAARLTTDRAGGHRFLGQYVADMVRVAAEPAPALARDLVATAEPTATRYRLAQTTASAVLSEATGDPETTATLYAEAATGWSTYGQVLEHALALLGQARSLTHLNRPDATPLLRVAHDHLTTLGARPSATEAAALLRSGGPGTL
jgi:class 3 adenylate cyclase/tetratricopeptide (TPR) repeat protein